MLRTLGEGNRFLEVDQGLDGATLRVQHVRHAVERIDLTEGETHPLCERLRFSIVAKRLLRLAELSERSSDVSEHIRLKSSVGYRSRNRKCPQVAVQGLLVSPERRQTLAQ